MMWIPHRQEYEHLSKCTYSQYPERSPSSTFTKQMSQAIYIMRVKKTRKRSADIQQTWLSRLGHVMTSPYLQTKTASAVTCRFCFSFGVEKGRVVTTKVFGYPYCTDNSLQHLRVAHPSKYFSVSAIGSTVAKQNHSSLWRFHMLETVESHFVITDQGLFLRVKYCIIYLLKLFSVIRTPHKQYPYLSNQSVPV